MPLSIVTKFHKDLTKTVLITEQTSLILDNSRAIIQLCRLDMIHLGIVTRFQEDIIKIV